LSKENFTIGVSSEFGGVGGGFKTAGVGTPDFAYEFDGNVVKFDLTLVASSIDVSTGFGGIVEDVSSEVNTKELASGFDGILDF